MDFGAKGPGFKSSHPGCPTLMFVKVCVVDRVCCLYCGNTVIMFGLSVPPTSAYIFTGKFRATDAGFFLF